MPDKQWHIIWVPKGYRTDTLGVLKLYCFNPEDEIYTPHYTVNKRNQIVNKYIFPGYIFVKCKASNELEDKVRSHCSGAMFLRNFDVDVAILEETDLENLRDIESRYRGNPEINELGLRSNDLVTIKSGPFSYRTGRITKITDEFIYVGLLLFTAEYEIPFRFFEVDKC